MKKCIYIIIFCLNALSNYSQGFINQYNINSYLDDRSFQVETTSYGHLIYGWSTDTFNTTQYKKISFIGTDPAGNILFTKKIQYPPDTSLWIDSSPLDMGSQLLKTNTFFYAIAQQTSAPSYPVTGIVCKLNEYADTIWKKEYKDPGNYLFITSINKADNNNLILSCYNKTPTNSRTLFLIKIDSSGNEIWRKYYDTKTNLSHFSRNTIFNPLSKKYYFCIETEITTPVGGIFIPFIYICDSLGNKINQKQLCPGYGFGLGGDGKISLSKDSLMYFFGYEFYDTTHVKTVLAKIDTSGNFIYKKLYGKPSPVTAFTDLIELPNNDIVLCGTLCDTIYSTTPPSPYTAANDRNFNGIITKIDKNGNLKWQSIIDISIRDIFTDIALIPNKGFALTGYLDYNVMLPNDHQKMLLVVTDSLGCYSSTCNYTGMDEFSNITSLNIYPNPTSQYLNIRFNEISDKIIEVTLYNLLGEIVLFKKEDCDTIDLTHLTNEVYIIEVRSESKIYRTKIIKN